MYIIGNTTKGERMDHLYNGESHYRIFHDPLRRTIELLDYSNTPEFEPGSLATKISEKALIELLLNAEKWGGGYEDWWRKLIKTMELMRRLDEKAENKTELFGSATGSV